MRIVVLDACRNNPFPDINDAGRGLAIVDAPRGSIVGYSTAPGMEAQDGDGNHSPYTSAFLNVAREPNLPIEQLFKRVRLEVNNRTDGRQTPWESSSLTSDFYFFGDTAVAATRAPDRSPIIQTASNLPSRSVRQAYDYVLSEGSPEYYEEFIRLYPHDPLCDRIRVLLGNLLVATAWHKAVLANSPVIYKSFHDNYGNSPYAKSALKLQVQPKTVPLMQFTHLTKSPAFKPANIGISPKLGISKDNLGAQANLPTPSKIITLPAKGDVDQPGQRRQQQRHRRQGHDPARQDRDQSDRRQQRHQRKGHHPARQDQHHSCYRYQEQRQRRQGHDLPWQDQRQPDPGPEQAGGQDGPAQLRWLLRRRQFRPALRDAVPEFVWRRRIWRRWRIQTLTAALNAK